jgi:site-specific DNA recombinase
MIELIAGGYARTSGTDRVSTKTQIDRCRTHTRLVAEQLSHEMQKQVSIRIHEDLIFIDKRRTGQHFERPSFARLKEAIAAGRLNLLFVYAVDRLGRTEDPTDMLLERKYCIEHKVRVFSVYDNLEITGKDDASLLSFFFASLQARRELERTRTRTQQNRFAHWRRDPKRWVFGGKVPFGYRLDDDYHLAINDEEAAIWLQMQAWALQEQASYLEIADRLNQDGIPPLSVLRGWIEDGDWSASEVRRRLMDDLYAGAGYKLTATDPDTEQEHQIVIPAPPLTSPDDFNTLQRVLKRRKRIKKRTNFYLLRGLLNCTICDTHFIGVSNRRGAHYVCVSRHRYWRKKTTSHCGTPMVRVNQLDPVIWQDIKDAISTDLIREAIEQHSTNELGVINARLADVTRRLNQKRRALRRLIKNLAEVEDIADEDDIKQVGREFRIEIDRLDQERIELEWSQRVVREHEGRIDHMVDLRAINLDNLPDEGKAALAQELVSHISIEHLEGRTVQVDVHYHVLDSTTDQSRVPLATFTIPSQPIILSC